MRPAFGKEVLKHCVDADISPSILADRCGVSRSYMLNVLRGDKRPSARITRLIIEALGLQGQPRFQLVQLAADAAGYPLWN